MQKLDKSSPKHIALVIFTFFMNLLLANFVLSIILSAFPFLQDCTVYDLPGFYQKTCTPKDGVAVFANIISLVFSIRVAIFAYHHPERWTI